MIWYRDCTFLFKPRCASSSPLKHASSRAPHLAVGTTLAPVVRAAAKTAATPLSTVSTTSPHLRVEGQGQCHSSPNCPQTCFEYSWIYFEFWVICFEFKWVVLSLPQFELILLVDLECSNFQWMFSTNEWFWGVDPVPVLRNCPVVLRTTNPNWNRKTWFVQP